MKNNTLTFGKLTALVSFIMGTIILLKFSISLDYSTIEVGFHFIKYAFYMNFIVFVVIFILMIADNKNVSQYSRTLFYMLSNIPVVIIYLIITMYISSLSEVTCENYYKESIKEVELNWGSGKETWTEIEPNESFFERFRAVKSPVVLKYFYQNKIHLDTLYYPYPSINEISSFSVSEKTKRLTYK